MKFIPAAGRRLGEEVSVPVSVSVEETAGVSTCWRAGVHGKTGNVPSYRQRGERFWWVEVSRKLEAPDQAVSPTGH
jgi:hypothetical protein